MLHIVLRSSGTYRWRATSQHLVCCTLQLLLQRYRRCLVLCTEEEYDGELRHERGVSTLVIRGNTQIQRCWVMYSVTEELTHVTYSVLLLYVLRGTCTLMLYTITRTLSSTTQLSSLLTDEHHELHEILREILREILSMRCTTLSTVLLSVLLRVLSTSTTSCMYSILLHVAIIVLVLSTT